MASLGWPAEAGPAQPAAPAEGPSPDTPTLGPQGWPQQALSSCGRPGMQLVGGTGADAGRSPATPTLGPQGWPQQPLGPGGRSGRAAELTCLRHVAGAQGSNACIAVMALRATVSACIGAASPLRSQG